MRNERSAVLGANDGIISTASLIVGVAAAATTQNEVLVAGWSVCACARELRLLDGYSCGAERRCRNQACTSRASRSLDHRRYRRRPTDRRWADDCGGAQWLIAGDATQEARTCCAFCAVPHPAVPKSTARPLCPAGVSRVPLTSPRSLCDPGRPCEPGIHTAVDRILSDRCRSLCQRSCAARVVFSALREPSPTCRAATTKRPIHRARAGHCSHRRNPDFDCRIKGARVAESIATIALTNYGTPPREGAAVSLTRR